ETTMSVINSDSRKRSPLAGVTTVVVVLLFMAPIAWFAATSLKASGLTFRLPPAWFFEPTLDHYRNVVGLGEPLESLWQSGQISNFMGALLNSTIIAVGSTLLSTFLGTLAAF